MDAQDQDTQSVVLDDKEHQAAYIFDPTDGADGAARPAKRRRVSKKHEKETARPDQSRPSPSQFQPLLDGAEEEACYRLRQSLFEKSWASIETRIHHVLREANQSTLEKVTSFIQESTTREARDKIPSGFIITGANIASQELLFEQLSETLQEDAEAKVVRLRSGDASNLKAALKKIIHEATSRSTDDGDDLDIAVGKDGRKYLNYDLEALYSHLKSSPRKNIVVCFQDSEAFESGLLSDLILLFSSWLDRIPFALLFGVATSVELFQGRLLKSTCHHLLGQQFDVEQSTSVIEKIFRAAVAHSEAPLRLGPSLLQSLLDRQSEQVAGIPVFVNSLKYAYMCHFYANPLSIVMADDLDDNYVKSQHLEIVRSLPSFRMLVEGNLEGGTLTDAKSLLDDDAYLISTLQKSRIMWQKWTLDVLRHVKILSAERPSKSGFIQLYLDALSNGIKVSEESGGFYTSVQRMPPTEAVSFLTNVLDMIQDGDKSLGLEGWAEDDGLTAQTLSDILSEIKGLQERAEEEGATLKSTYSSQRKILRTTVIAQKVQLSQDTADLTDDDKAYTQLIRRLVDHLASIMSASRPDEVPFHEIWLYDSKTPYRDVFIPRPRAVIERALLRPHDYLSCSCCKSGEDEIKPTFPSTAILYKLYLETGSLINVADLWSAYYNIVGEETDKGLDERTALALFYRALSELKTLGFVKQSRKKADHIAKLAWQGL
ncbi:hypothetical protein JX265_004720 [Neoarthrinium moseri]|uniref:Origin recognition complex subunit n=1 Tax=Neoarthrinium moseri TaxID=1658444 RepID=A0A9Q0AQS1_9PEZI|nr:hypothetical protein JX265_004720 [Neoarthrinium moseri]